jgi:hypothetical protein
MGEARVGLIGALLTAGRQYHIGNEGWGGPGKPSSFGTIPGLFPHQGQERRGEALPRRANRRTSGEGIKPDLFQWLGVEIHRLTGL